MLGSSGTFLNPYCRGMERVSFFFCIAFHNPVLYQVFSCPSFLGNRPINNETCTPSMYTHTFLSLWHLAYTAEEFLVYCCCKTMAGNASAASNKSTGQQLLVKTRIQSLSPSSDFPQEDWQLGTFNILQKILVDSPTYSSYYSSPLSYTWTSTEASSSKMPDLAGKRIEDIWVAFPLMLMCHC